MHVGTVREIKNHEYRVGLTPESARELVEHGHQVTVETGAGLGIGAADADYEAVGAEQSALENLSGILADQIVARLAIYAARTSHRQ